MSQDAFDMLKRIRMDLTAAQAKITDLNNILSEMNLTDRARPKCSTCGLSFKHSLARDEHLYHAHDGPEPPAWLAAEQLAEQMSEARQLPGAPENPLEPEILIKSPLGLKRG